MVAEGYKLMKEALWKLASISEGDDFAGMDEPHAARLARKTLKEVFNLEARSDNKND
jgi:hypothetical protein